MTEIASLTMRLSPRPIRFSHTVVTDPAGDYAPLSGGDLVYTAFFQNPAEVPNTINPITVPFNQPIQVQGVTTTVSSIEGFWRRPGFQEEFISLGQLTDLGGGNWEIATGFEAIIFESGVDHGSAPWTDIDFVAKIVSPEGVTWTAIIDTNISHAQPGVPATNTIDPLFGSDCISAQGALAYSLESTEVAAGQWVARCCDPAGVVEYRFDYEGDWATGTFSLLHASYGGGHDFDINVTGGQINVTSEATIQPFAVALTHGIADATRQQIRLVVRPHVATPDVKLYKSASFTTGVIDNSKWGSTTDQQGDAGDRGNLLTAYTTWQVGTDSAGLPSLTGILREFFMGVDAQENEGQYGLFGDASTHWRLDGSTANGDHGDLDDDEVGQEYQVFIVGGAGFSVCWTTA